MNLTLIQGLKLGLGFYLGFQLGAGLLGLAVHIIQLILL